MALIAENAEKKIWDYLKSKGLNNYGISGLMGNLLAESGLKSNNLQDNGNTKLGMTDDEYTKAVDNGTYTKEQFIYDGFGYSLPQWTWHQRKKSYYEYAKSKNKSIGDLETSLEFLYKELSESYTSVLNTLKTATSVLEASNAVLLKFECPADQSVSMQNKRASYGQSYYNKYAKNGNMESESIMGYKTTTKGKAVKLSNNFNSTEMDCHGNGCCSTTLINEKLVEYLQKIREHFGKPITITSGYRCVKHNSSPTVGGATGSRHTKGDAADIVVSGVIPAEVAKYAESIGIKGIGLYSNFVHIDTRTTKSFWYGHEQAYRSTFGGTPTATITNNTTTNTNNSSTTNTNFSYIVGKTYKTQVMLNVRSGAGTNYSKKKYSQLTLNARKFATSDGCLKVGTSVTCMEVKKVGNDIWIRIPSGWCAAYCGGKYYIK